MIRVLIVDDQKFVREVTAALLQATEGITVVGQCADGAEALEASAATNPDVVLMDVEMPVMTGLEATRQLAAAQPSARVLLTTASALSATPKDAADAGAAGWLLKGLGGAAALVEAIRVVAGGGNIWPLG